MPDRPRWCYFSDAHRSNTQRSQSELHPVPTVPAVAERLDLLAFGVPIKSREFTPGRSDDPVVVVFACWLYAAIDNVTGGRQLERLCWDHLAGRRWTTTR